MTRLSLAFLAAVVLLVIVRETSGYGHMRMRRPRSMCSCSCRGRGMRRMPMRYRPRMRSYRRHYVRRRPQMVITQPRRNIRREQIVGITNNILGTLRRTVIDSQARKRQEEETRRLREETRRLRETRRREEQRRIEEDRRRREEEITRIRRERETLERRKEELTRIREEKIRRETIIREEKRRKEDIEEKLRIEKQRRTLELERQKIELERIKTQQEIERQRIKTQELIRREKLKTQLEIDRLNRIRNENTKRVDRTIVTHPDLNHNIITTNILNNWKPRLPTDITTINKDYYRTIITRITNIINKPPTTPRQTITNLPGTIKDITELTVAIVQKFVRDVQKPKPPTIDTMTSTNIINVINQINTRIQQIPPIINFPGMPINLTPYKPDWTTMQNLITQLVNKQIMLPSFKRSIMVIPTHFKPIQETITRVVTTIQNPPLITQPTLLQPLNDIFFVFSTTYFFSTIKTSCITETTLPPVVFQSTKVTVQKVLEETKITSVPPTKNPDRFITVRRRRRRSVASSKKGTDEGHVTPSSAKRELHARLKALRDSLSRVIVAISDNNSNASLSSGAKLSEDFLQLAELFVSVRAHQKQLFESYQLLQTRFAAAVTALRVSVTAALARIDLRSSVIPEVGAAVTRQLKVSYRLLAAIEGNFDDKKSFLRFFRAQFRDSDAKLLAAVRRRAEKRRKHVPVLVALLVLAQTERVLACELTESCDRKRTVEAVRKASSELRRLAQG